MPENRKQSYGVQGIRIHLPSLLDDVEQGEEIVVTRNGRPIGRLVPFDSARNQATATIAEIRNISSSLALGSLCPADLVSGKPA
jgi:prevent-host-death family protein